MTTSLEQRREKYTRQPVPRRLGNLSSNLNRIATYSDGSFSKESILELIRESQHFAEWTIGDAPLEIALNLVEMQRDAKQWSDKLIDWMEATQAA